MHKNFANILVTDGADPTVLTLLYGIYPPIEGPFFLFYI